MLGVYFYTSNRQGDEYLYLRIGLAVKVFGGISFGLIYMFYYGYGDTFTYFESAKILGGILLDTPIYGLKLIFNLTDYVRAEDYLYNHFLVNYYRGNDTFAVIKIAGFLSAIAGGGFFSTTILFSCFAFFGQWKLYSVFIYRYPKQKLALAIAHFLIPSVVFWGAGIMKDSLVLGFLGIAIYCFDLLFFRGSKSVKYFISLAISVYFIYTIKSYVLLALVPATLFWLFFSYNKKIKSSVLRVVIFPVILLIVSFTSIFSYFAFQSIDERFTTDKLFNQAVTYQTNHYSEVDKEGTRSGYTLGDFDRTFGGLIEQIIPSLVVTFFRPFPWEIKNVVMALSSLESLVLTFFTLYVVFKLRIGSLIRYFSNDSFLIMSLVFTLIFAFIVGFSSYNFGALARYKIPCLPFYFSVLILLVSDYKEWSNKKSYQKPSLKFRGAPQRF